MDSLKLVFTQKSGACLLQQLVYADSHRNLPQKILCGGLSTAGWIQSSLSWLLVGLIFKLFQGSPSSDGDGSELGRPWWPLC